MFLVRGIIQIFLFFIGEVTKVYVAKLDQTNSEVEMFEIIIELSYR